MSKPETYPGIDNDKNNGMTDVGRNIKDSLLFDFIPETKSCAGSTVDKVQDIYDKTPGASEPFGHFTSHLSDSLKEKFTRVNEEAIKHTRENGWDPELGDND